MPNPVGATRLTADGLVAEGPVYFWGAAVVAAADGAVVTLRNGLSVLGPIRLDWETPNAGAHPFMLERPILFQTGLFADLDTNVTAATIFWEPLPGPAYSPPAAAIVDTEEPS